MAQGRIDRAVDGRLTIEERFLLEDHLAACCECNARFARATALQEQLQRWPEPPVERREVERAVSAIRASIAEGGTRGRLPMPSRRRRLAAIAAVVIVGGAAALWAAWTRDGNGDRETERGPEVVVGAGQPERPQAGRDLPLPTEERVATAPAPSLGEGDELDPLRLDAVRAQVRDRLGAAFAGFSDGDDPRPVAARFDDVSRDLRRAEWPVLRLVEDMLSDSDAAVVRSAARYLGVRGGRTAVVRMGATLETSPAREALVRALGDLGAPAVPALAEALRMPDVADLALLALERIGGGEAAEAIEAEVRRAADDPDRREMLLRRLAAIGPPAIESFLRLAEAEPADASSLLRHLDVVDGADEEFARILRESGRRYSVSLLLEGAVRLQTASALAWVAELSEDYRHRDAALSCLERWDGPEPFDVLLEMDARGAVPDEELLHTLGELIDRDPVRLHVLVEERLADRRTSEVEHILDLLLATENPWAGESLAYIALSDLLSPAARQWAALAVAEFGMAADAERLRAGMSGIDPSERRLLAACLIAVYVHLGPDGASRVLEELTARSSPRVLSALSSVDSSATGAVGLHRVARALGNLPNARSPKPRGSSQ